MGITSFKPKTQPQDQNTDQSDKTEDGYFNLITTGVGYLSRYRVIKPANGDSYVRVNISALEGPKNEPSYVYFDNSIAGKTALQLCQELQPAIDDRDTKVLVGFSLGSARPISYVPTSGKHKGKQQTKIDARLLSLDWVRLKEKGGDYELVYERDKTPEQENRAVAEDQGEAESIAA